MMLVIVFTQFFFLSFNDEIMIHLQKKAKQPFFVALFIQEWVFKGYIYDTELRE